MIPDVKVTHLCSVVFGSNDEFYSGTHCEIILVLHKVQSTFFWLIPKTSYIEFNDTISKQNPIKD